jgi:hypothetical protein
MMMYYLVEMNKTGCILGMIVNMNINNTNNFVCNVVVCINNLFIASTKYHEENRLKLTSTVLCFLVLLLLLYINQY